MTALLSYASRSVSLAHCLFDPGNYRLAQKQIDEDGLELRSASFANRLYCLTEASRSAIAAAMCDRVEAVRNRNDARLQRNPFSPETVRIAFSVPTFVVRGDAAPEIGIKRAKRIENFSATLWMGFHCSPLLRRELGCLVEDVRQSSVELADVVKQCDALNAAQPVPVEPCGPGQNQRVRRDSAHVLARLFVVGIDRIEQRFHRRRGESLGFGPRSVLAVEKSAGGDGY
jgi:hypothetical protein